MSLQRWISYPSFTYIGFTIAVTLICNCIQLPKILKSWPVWCSTMYVYCSHNLMRTQMPISLLEQLILDIFRLLMLISALMRPPCILSVQTNAAMVLQDSQCYLMNSLHSLVQTVTTSALAKTAKGLGTGKSLRSKKETVREGGVVFAMWYKVRIRFSIIISLPALMPANQS